MKSIFNKERTIKAIIVLLCLSFTASPTFAEKSCEELKTEIEARFEAKGVKNYTLAIVKTEAIKDQKAKRADVSTANQPYNFNSAKRLPMAVSIPAASKPCSSNCWLWLACSTKVSFKPKCNSGTT